jgi:hypothetical protein
MMAASPTFSEVLAPAELTAFLSQVKVPQYATAMCELGFEDVDDFKNYDVTSIERMRQALLSKSVPEGHVNKIMRGVEALAVVVQPPGVSPSTITPLHSPAQPGTSPSALETVQRAAVAVGAAAMSLASETHAAKVRSLIERQTKLCPEAPRLLFGFDHDGTSVSEFNQLMNKVALELVQQDPTLINFHGRKPKTGNLIAAARVQANAKKTKRYRTLADLRYCAHSSPT